VLQKRLPPMEAGPDPLGSGALAPIERQKSLDDLVSRALAYRTGPELKALFDFIRRFPHMAPFNAMLLYVQNPGIRFALRAPVWERKYGRRVRLGARPYVILQTMGPVAFVFDISDTDRDPGSLFDDVPEAVLNPFPAKAQPPPYAIEKITAACATLRIAITKQDYGSNLAGQVIRLGGTSAFVIVLNEKHAEAQQLGTLAHELAHVFCGHLGETEEGFWPDCSGAVKQVKEFEAEAVAYLVTDRMNLDIGSVQYLAGYLTSDAQLPNYSLDTVLKAAGKIEEMAAGKFRLKKRKQRWP
jgi:hypothetical protein